MIIPTIFENVQQVLKTWHEHILAAEEMQAIANVQLEDAEITVERQPSLKEMNTYKCNIFFSHNINQALPADSAFTQLWPLTKKVTVNFMGKVSQVQMIIQRGLRLENNLKCISLFIEETGFVLEQAMHVQIE